LIFALDSTLLRRMTLSSHSASTAAALFGQSPTITSGDYYCSQSSFSSLAGVLASLLYPTAGRHKPELFAVGKNFESLAAK
jgi:hypothetical protein